MPQNAVNVVSLDNKKVTAMEEIENGLAELNGFYFEIKDKLNQLSSDPKAGLPVADETSPEHAACLPRIISKINDLRAGFLSVKNRL